MSDLRERYARALADCDESDCFLNADVPEMWDADEEDRNYYLKRADAVLAVRDAEVERLRARLIVKADLVKHHRAERDAAEATVARVKSVVAAYRRNYAPPSPHTSENVLIRGVEAALASVPAVDAGDSDMTRWTREMHYHLGAHVNEGPPSADIPDDLRDVRIALLDEEVREYREAAEAGDLVGVADGLADVVYVAYGTAHTYGIPLDAVLAEVHRSNMSKSPNPDGGKFIKGPGYSPPRVALILKPEPPEGTDPYSTECVFDATGCTHVEHRHDAVDAGDREPASEVQP